MKLIQSVRLLCLCFLSAATLNTLHADSWQLTTRSIAAGQTQALALRSDGSLWSWGENQYGEMGIGNVAYSTFPVRISGVSNVVNMAAGWNHSLAVGSSGSVWAWGNNQYGQLGNGTIVTNNVPGIVSGITNAVAVSGGANHSLALLASGQVMDWGLNGNGQLGNGTSNNYFTLPNLVPGLSNVVKIVAGGNHSLALDKNGTVWAWGYGGYGQVGNGQFNNVIATPVAVFSNAVDVAAGNNHTIALKNDGTVWVWGYGINGQLGLGNNWYSYSVPEQVTNLSGVQSIGAGQDNSAATLTNGQNLVWGWQYAYPTYSCTVGTNSYTKTGVTNFLVTPTALAPAPAFLKYTFAQVQANAVYNFSSFVGFGLTTNGTVWAWGENENGQFGNGNIVCPPTGNLSLIPSQSFGATPPARPGEFIRGNLFDDLQGVPENNFYYFYNNTVNDLDFCSIVVPLDMEQGVAQNSTGRDAYCYSNSAPWFLSISNQTLYVTTDLNNPGNPGTGSQLAENNPVVAFGSQGGGSVLYPNQPYRFGVYAGGYFESTNSPTNVIRISVYSASNFVAGATNVMPVNVVNIALPRRTISADSNAWTAFMNNGASITVTTNGLTTTVQFMDTGNPNSLPFGLSWYNGALISNFILTGYQLTHIATGTNYCYRVEVLGAVQTGNSSLSTFAVDGQSNWTPAPLYTLDFSQPPSTHSAYLDRIFFQGVPTPPTYTEATMVGAAGITQAVTNQYALTNNFKYKVLDGSPELRRHPVLDQFVKDLNNDPLALASYVINQIELVDPYAIGNGSTTVQPQITCGGVDRSALGTFLEGQGSPIEQCELLVYLLRQAGYSAAYVFPTNNNLFMSASHISQLWEMQVNGVLYPNGIPYITNSLLTVNYPWVVANIGTNTVHIFPWLKDHEIVEGANLYDYLPPNYNNALAWVEQYCRANTNILNLDSNNVVGKLFPAFVQKYLSPLGPSFSMDSLGVRALNRQHQFPSWNFLPQPDAVSNLTSVAVVDNLNDTVNFSFLTNIFNQAQVQICDPAGFDFLDTGVWNACDFHDRKMLFFTSNGRLNLWLAPYRPDIGAIQSFAGPSSTALQSNSVPYGGYVPGSPWNFTNGLQLTFNLIHRRQVNTLMGSTRYLNYPSVEQPQIINVAHCNVGDVAAMVFDYGRVTPLMMQQHEETYWGLQRQIATNSAFTPAVWDYSGTAAYLLGTGYFQKFDTFDAANQQWHKLHSLVRFSSGLGIIGATSSTNRMQVKVDMMENIEMYLGNGSIHTDSGANVMLATPAWQNYINLYITGSSSQEHDVIQSMFSSQDAVSTVRLLQLAQQRATNDNTAVLELYNNSYSAAGNNTNSGYGTNLLKNVDPQTWSIVSSVFNQNGGAYSRVLMTPGNITNATKSYIGMGALVFGQNNWKAWISGNSAPLNGGYSETFPLFSSSSSGLSYSLTYSGSGNLTFSWNDSSTGSLLPAMPSLQTYASMGNGNSYNYNQQQGSQASQGSAGLGTGLGATTGTTIRAVADSGFWSPPKFLGAMGTLVYDPVNVYSGEFYVDTVDLSMPGPFPLQLRRNYTSQSLQPNAMGFGWKINFNPYLCLATNLIYGAELDGTTLAYRLTNGVWKVLPQDNPTLNNNSTRGIGSTGNLFNTVLTTNNGTNYVINSPDGSVRTYQVMTFPIVSGTNQMNRTRPYLVSWTDDAGNYASFFYGTNSAADDWGQLNRINVSNGNTLVFKYDFYGRIIQAITGDGRFVNYQYDTFGDLTTVTLPDLSQCQYQYQHYTYTTTNATNVADSYHLLTQETTPNGRILANNYDAMRRVVAQASTVGTNLVLVTNAYFYYTNNINTNNYLTNSYVSGVTRVEDVFHNPTLYCYTNNLITNTVDPLGGTNLTVWFLDSQTNLAGYYPRSIQYTVDKRGLTNQFYFDSFGNVTQKVVLGNLTGEGVSNQSATNTATFTSNNLPSVVRDPSGNGIQYVYDGSDLFRPLQTIMLAGPTPIVTNFFYYTNVTQVSSLGVTNQAFGLRWRMVYGGATNDAVFNGNGFPIQKIQYPATASMADTDPAVIRNLSYNNRGQLYQDQVVGGGMTQFDYDPMGRMISRQAFDGGGNTLSQEFFYYNRNGQLEWYAGPRANPQNYIYFIYDGAGRAIQQIKARSQAKSDGSGVEAPAGNNQYATTFQTFDGFGNLTSVTDPRGALTSFSYDALGRKTQQLAYDLNGTVLSTNQFAYEKGGLMTATTNGLGGVSRSLYTSTGNPYYVSTPDGATNGVTYYLDGRVKRQIQGNGAYWQTSYNDAAQTVTRIFYTSTGVGLATNITQYDARHNVIQTTDEGGNLFTTAFDGLNRVKSAIGPAEVTVTASGGSGLSFGGTTTYTTNSLQHAVTNVFDAAGLVASNFNAAGEKTVTTLDPLGRTTSVKFYTPGGSLVREKYLSYSADHNSVTVTDGSGASAISRTTYTDNDGNTVLSVGYPSATMTEFTLNQYDVAGNLVGSLHKSSGNVSTTWTTAGFVYDGLNRLTQQVDRDGAVTTIGYNALNEETNRVMPGTNLVWSATYNNAGQKLTEKDSAGGLTTRNNSYTYNAGGTTWAGLLNTFTDGRGVILTNRYDDWLRVTNITTTGALAEQQMSASLQYDPRGLLTGISQSYASTNTGPATSITRTFDAYGQLASENGLTQGWDQTGRRTQVGSIGFAYQADGQMTVVNGSSFSYATSGLLSSKVNGARTVSIDQRDGEGRPLQMTTQLGSSTVMRENWAWTGDGLPASYTVQRDFTDVRNFGYAPLSRRMVSETLNLSGSTAITNVYAFDKGVPAGPGVMTQAGQGVLAWSGATDAFSRIQSETNAVIHRTARGHFNGAASLRGYLNSQPLDIRFDSHSAGIWNSDMALKQGTNALSVYADHPGGFFTTNRQSTFNVSTGGPDQETSAYDGAGNITNRVWKNGSGQIVKTQTLTWDAFGRLVRTTERDTNTNGINYTVVFDGLWRQVQTTETTVTNGLLLASNPAPVVVNFVYDPQAKFLPVSITVSQGATARQDWLVYGPDISGRYGGMQGVGGLENIITTTPGMNATVTPLNDYFGNVLGAITNGSVVWTPSRLNLYAPVEGYSPPRLSLNSPTYASLGYRTRPVTAVGYVQLGKRPYELASRAFMSGDPFGHVFDPALNTAFYGNPASFYDPEGLFGKSVYNEVALDASAMTSSRMWGGMGNDFYTSFNHSVNFFNGGVYQLMNSTFMAAGLLAAAQEEGMQMAGVRDPAQFMGVGQIVEEEVAALKLIGGLSRSSKIVRGGEQLLLTAEATPAGANLIGAGDRLAQAAQWVKPQQGVFDVVVHGSEDSFHVLHNGSWVEIDQRSLATFIGKNGWNGEPVRLISCSSGSSPTGVAQNLANKLGVEVTAPNNTVWIHPNGNLTVGPSATVNNGSWNVFGPGGGH